MKQSIGCTKTIYCHGLPGSAAEINFLDNADPKPSHILGPQHVSEFSRQLEAEPDQALHVVGFSLGAMAAIQIAERNAQSVCRLSLISPAAPLELGDFLPNMAGKLVFETAMRSAFQFRFLTALQYTGVCLFSEKIINTIFKDSPNADNALLSETTFKHALVAGLKESYGKNRHAYNRAIGEYVQPWKHRLTRVTCPVSIHHGTADNWAPIEMAYALQEEFNSSVDMIEYTELGHYSTLRQALPVVLKSIN